ncbi:hypothetical protein Taro_006489 [Colocasia esculenta]|uniref:Uncharacterized protein n=1 Tax=Colocasia esculenta TaxID=4460 RepID=A0A843TXS9_COLES|nr:hypothetical protein [Colocasia esculenta]
MVTSEKQGLEIKPGEKQRLYINRYSDRDEEIIRPPPPRSARLPGLLQGMDLLRLSHLFSDGSSSARKHQIPPRFQQLDDLRRAAAFPHSLAARLLQDSLSPFPGGSRFNVVPRLRHRLAQPARRARGSAWTRSTRGTEPERSDLAPALAMAFLSLGLAGNRTKRLCLSKSLSLGGFIHCVRQLRAWGDVNRLVDLAKEIFPILGAPMPSGRRKEGNLT